MSELRVEHAVSIKEAEQIRISVFLVILTVVISVYSGCRAQEWEESGP